MSGAVGTIFPASMLNLGLTLLLSWFCFGGGGFVGAVAIVMVFHGHVAELVLSLGTCSTTT